MSKLPYLIHEVNASLEIYLSGRTGQQYNRTAFILCDDCAELASKLFLITDTPAWSDRRANNSFKNFVDFTTEVLNVFLATRNADHPAANTLVQRIRARRGRRNEFFHSTNLLDLNFHARDCVEAFCDVLDYGELLFPADWAAAVTLEGNMETCAAIVRLDRKSYSDPGVGPKVNEVFAKWPTASGKAKAKGCEVAHHAEDLHLRLAIRNGGKALRDRLVALL